MRTKSLKQKISAPFILLILLFPLAMLLLFNIAFRLYINSNTKSELKTASKTIATTVNRELANGKIENSDALDKAFAKMYKSLRASKLKASTDIFLYDQNGRLLYPDGTGDDSASGQLTGRIAKRLPAMQENRVYSIAAGGQRYFVLSYPLDGSNESLVFAAHTDQADFMGKAVNFIFIALMLLGVAAAALTANRLSLTIAKPVADLCGVTKAIGEGKFSTPVTKQAGDIAELQQLYENIGEMAARLEAYDKSQKTFLQNASHELRTPLMSIQGYAEGIAGGVLPDVKAAAGIIESESVRLNKLVEELLTLSRIESQTYQKELAPMNLCDALKEYAQRLGGYAAKQRRELRLTLPDVPVTIQADDALLSQAVMNIASNCLRYAKTGASIALAGRDRQAVIRITDDGGLIDESDLPHLFDRFYKGKGGNFGLGLAIAKSAAEFMKGSARAYNTPAGPVFEMIFPVI